MQTFFPLNNSCCFINLYKVFFFFKKKHCINTIPLMGHNLPQLPTTLGLVTSLSPLHRANFLKLLAHIPQCNSCYPYHIMDIFFNLSLFLVWPIFFTYKAIIFYANNYLPHLVSSKMPTLSLMVIPWLVSLLNLSTNNK